jgi:hypothetical protein
MPPHVTLPEPSNPASLTPSEQAENDLIAAQDAWDMLDGLWDLAQSGYDMTVFAEADLIALAEWLQAGPPPRPVAPAAPLPPGGFGPAD